VEIRMQKLSRLVVAASTAALVFFSARVALAQGTPTTAPAPATAATPSTAAPETTTAEKPTADKPAAEKAEKEKSASKKKKPAKMTRQQEIDRSIDRGTVPARYRSSVPKEYQQYIPFDKK
jgi:cytoskeletal protein RodZ